MDGVLFDGALGVTDHNSRLSKNLNQFGLDHWPPHNSLTSELKSSLLHSHFPISVKSRQLNAVLAKSYSDDFYNRIYFSPSQLDIGVLSQDLERSVKVWNAYLDSKTLSDIVNRDTEGFDIQGVDSPTVFRPLQEITSVCHLLLDGPVKIDIDLIWQFSGVPAPYHFAITGSRVQPFFFAPNWEEPLLERIEYLTNILRGDSGIEQRRALRRSPRRSVRFEVLVHGGERVKLDMMLHGIGPHKYWSLPLWQDIQLVNNLTADSTEIRCNTAQREFSEGGLIVLLGETVDHFEIREVDTVLPDRIILFDPVLNDWRQARLMPLKTARISDLNRQRALTAQTFRSEFEFTFIDGSGPEEMSLPRYLNWPVWEIVPNHDEDNAQNYIRLLQTLDNAVNTPYVTDTAKKSLHYQVSNFILQGASERAQFRALLHFLKGRQKAVWLPTFADDILVISVGTKSLDIYPIGYAQLGFNVGRNTIRIVLHDGTIFYRRITAAVALEDRERIGFDNVFDQDFIPADIRQVSFMVLVRQEADQAEIEHITDNDGVAKARIAFRGVLDEASI